MPADEHVPPRLKGVKIIKSYECTIIMKMKLVKVKEKERVTKV